MKLAKRLKKEKVNVDIINFGEEVSEAPGQGPGQGFASSLGSSPSLSPWPQEANTDKLTAFINTLNGKDGSGSHLVTVPPGPSLADALISSPILAGEGGAMLGLGASDFEFGVDPSADPELALVSTGCRRAATGAGLGPAELCPTQLPARPLCAGSAGLHGRAAAAAGGGGQEGRRCLRS